MIKKSVFIGFVCLFHKILKEIIIVDAWIEVFGWIVILSRVIDISNHNS